MKATDKVRSLAFKYVKAWFWLTVQRIFSIVWGLNHDFMGYYMCSQVIMVAADIVRIPIVLIRYAQALIL